MYPFAVSLHPQFNMANDVRFSILQFAVKDGRREYYRISKTFIKPSRFIDFFILNF